MNPEKYVEKEEDEDEGKDEEELERERREWQELKDLANSDISSGPEYYGAMGGCHDSSDSEGFTNAK